MISNEACSYISYYRLDRVGTKFLWEDRLFIRINEEAEEFVFSLFDSGLMKELIEKNLFADTWISDLEFEGCGLVLEQVYYSNNLGIDYWSLSMLKDAAITFLEAGKICVKHGFSMSDTHHNNVMYVNGRFIICDIGAIDVKMNYGKYSPTVQNIKSCIYYPLLAANKGLFGDETISITSRLSEEWRVKCAYDIPYWMTKILLNYNSFRKHALDGTLRQKYGQRHDVKGMLKLRLVKLLDGQNVNGVKMAERTIAEIENVERKIKNYKINTSESNWGKYQENFDIKSPSERFQCLSNVIKSMDIDDSVELGGNQGYFSRLLLEQNIVQNAITTDYSMAIDKAYDVSKQYNGHLLTYKLDFNKLDIHVAQKLKSNVCICLAMTHHLILVQCVDIDKIIERLCWLTNRYVIVEFMPLGLWGGGEEKPEIPSWYTLEWFCNHMNKKFDIVDKIQTEPNRIAIIGMIKEDQNGEH